MSLITHLPTTVASILLLLLAAVTIFLALNGLVQALRQMEEAQVNAMVKRALGTKAWRGLLLGAAATVVVQSSSVVLSLLVPLAGTGFLTLAQGFPIAIGANIGTTVTALVAAAAVVSSMLSPAIQIALVHLLFNLAGAALLYPVERLRRIPMAMSQWLANVAVESKTRALIYLVLIFYGIPGLALLLS